MLLNAARANKVPGLERECRYLVGLRAKNDMTRSKRKMIAFHGVSLLFLAGSCARVVEN
jgi:hypothetical protein